MNRPVLREVPASFVFKSPWFVNKEKRADVDVDFSPWWDEREPATYDPKYEDLADLMRDWTESIEGEGGSDVIFAAGVALAMEGVTGWQKVRLLELVPADPPWEIEDLKRKAQESHKRAVSDEVFGVAAVDEFAEDPAAPAPAKAKDAVKTAEDGALVFGDDIRIYSMPQIRAMQLDFRWLIERVLIDKLPQGIGGHDKCFKTGIMASELIALATGAPFLGHFDVVQQRKCLFLTAEIGLLGVQSLLRRIAEFHGLDAGGGEAVLVSTWLPNVKDDNDLRKLRRILDAIKPDVLALDPWYFAAGATDLGDMFKAGDLLRRLSKICAARGILLIIAHHATKLRKDAELVPMQLAEFTGAGFSSFVRQWILLSHSVPFADGRASLWANIGSSAFTSPLHIIDIDEGVTDPKRVDSRHWRPSVREVDPLAAEQTTRQRILDLAAEHESISWDDVAIAANVTDSEAKEALKRLVRSGDLIYEGKKYRLNVDDADEFKD